MRSPFLLIFFIFFSSSLVLLAPPRAAALNVGVSATITLQNQQLQCSRKCESEHCDVPPLLRYGKYCGILYSGCPGEKPCDGLDACCQIHDTCVQSKNNDFLNEECNENLLDCIGRFRDSGEKSFKGNKCSTEEVADVISLVIEAALLAGRLLHKP